MIHVIFVAVSLFTTAPKHFVHHVRSKAYIDIGAATGCQHIPHPSSRQNEVLVDSSGNGYSMWTQMHECLAYNPIVEGLQFVNRGYSPTGILHVHQTDNMFSFWVHDVAYNQEYGVGRYPHSIASNPGPHLCFTNGMHAVGIYESSGWWSGFWDSPVDLGNDAYRCISTQLVNSNMLFIAFVDTSIFFEIWDCALINEICAGLLGSNMYYWGCDVNDDIGYIFFYDDSLNVYYYTFDSTFSDLQQYNLIWPEPYANNVLYWTQMAVNDSGTPFLILNIINGDDSTYPFQGKVYVSTTEGEPCVDVSAGLERTFYPTIAAEENYTIALFHSARDTSGIDSLCWWDLYWTASTDHGETWLPAYNLTQNLTVRPGLAQIAKRLDATTGRFFYVYGVNQLVNHDPIWHVSMDPEGLDPHAWFVGYAPVPGVEEHSTEAPSRLSLTITNPVLSRACVSYALPYAIDVTLKLFDRTGRLVNTIDQGYKDTGIHEFYLDTHKLPCGTYILILDTPDEYITQTMVVVH